MEFLSSPGWGQACSRVLLLGAESRTWQWTGMWTQSKHLIAVGTWQISGPQFPHLQNGDDSNLTE